MCNLGCTETTDRAPVTEALRVRPGPLAYPVMGVDRAAAIRADELVRVAARGTSILSGSQAPWKSLVAPLYISNTRIIIWLLAAA